MSSLGLRLVVALVLPPVLVAAALVVAAAHLVREDKELYGYDLATQTVDLLARNLETKLASLRRQGARGAAPEAPFLSLERRAGASDAPIVTNVSRAGTPLLAVTLPGAPPRIGTLAPSALLDLSRAGPSRLQLINERGTLLAHADAKAVAARTKVSSLLEQLDLFRDSAPRLGTKEVRLGGQPTLLAFARVRGGLALIQSIPKTEVSAAAAPLIRAAALVSGGVVLVALILAWLLSRRIVGPMKAMAEQAEAIARGDFKAAEEAQSPRAAGEVAALALSLQKMRQALARREEELAQMQQRLLQSERLNAVNRVVVAVSNELAGPLEEGLLAAQRARHALPGGVDAGWLETLRATLERSSGMLQKLRRLETTADNDEAQVMDAALAVVDVLLSARPILAARQISVEFEPSDPWPMRVHLSAVQSALLDILSYLAAHAEEGSVVRVSIHDQSPFVAIAFNYLGVPLSATECDELLSPLAAVERGATLVLAVAATAVAEEGGQLSLEPTLEGNVIWLQLPGPDEPAVVASTRRRRRSREVTAPTLPVGEAVEVEILETNNRERSE